MTWHLCKLLWNRKRANLLLIIEIFLSFIVLFGVVLLATFYADNYRRPLGFDWQHVWSIGVNTSGERETPEQKAAVKAAFEALKREVAQLPEVEGVATAFTTPYSNSGWTSGHDLENGKKLRYGVNMTSDEFAGVMALEVIQGRWFNREDDAMNWKPVVMNQRLALDAFGDRHPIGQAVPQGKPSKREANRPPRPELRVVGVVRDFRKDGELAAPDNFMFQRFQSADLDRAPSILVIKVRPATTAAFEEALMKRLHDTQKAWSFEIEPLVQLRESSMRERLAPLLAAGSVASFLLIMVGLGLFGVLWQTVTQRTRELGLRRAKGATASRIHRQIVGEVLMITTIAVTIALVLAAQLPLLDLLGWVSAGVFAASLAISIVCIYGLTTACAWYPGRLATRIQPAEALHYE